MFVLSSCVPSTANNAKVLWELNNSFMVLTLFSWEFSYTRIGRIKINSQVTPCQCSSILLSTQKFWEKNLTSLVMYWDAVKDLRGFRIGTAASPCPLNVSFHTENSCFFIASASYIKYAKIPSGS